MNMQQLMAQAQQIQRTLKKALTELGEKEFSTTKGGAVTVTMYGNKKIKSININDDAFEKDNKEMIEDMIVVAYNELLEAIEQAEGDIKEKITGSRTGGLGM